MSPRFRLRPQCALHRGPRWHCSTDCAPKQSVRGIYTWRVATFTLAPNSGALSTSTCVSLHQVSYLLHKLLIIDENSDAVWQPVTLSTCHPLTVHCSRSFVLCCSNDTCDSSQTKNVTGWLIDWMLALVYKPKRVRVGSWLQHWLPVPVLGVCSGRWGVRRRGVHCERRLYPLRPDGQAGLLRHRHGPAQTGNNHCFTTMTQYETVMQGWTNPAFAG